MVFGKNMNIRTHMSSHRRKHLQSRYPQGKKTATATCILPESPVKLYVQIFNRLRCQLFIIVLNFFINKIALLKQ